MDAIINDLTTFPVNSMCVPGLHQIPSATYIQLLEKLLCHALVVRRMLVTTCKV